MVKYNQEAMVHDPVTTQLAIVGFLFALGNIFFGAFEQGTAPLRRVLKLLIIGGGSAWLAAAQGLLIANAVLVALFLTGGTFHVWWCRKNGIDVLRPEPREKYYRLRGWKVS
ncbi:MAG: hypothetical protein ABI823_00360 [Bryobacteraceae bacterium]